MHLGLPQLGAWHAILAPVIDPSEGRFHVERLRGSGASAVAGDAGRGCVGQAEEPRQLLVAHYVGRLVRATRPVAGLAGDAGERIGRVGAPLLARSARTAHASLALYG